MHLTVWHIHASSAYGNFMQHVLYSQRANWNMTRSELNTANPLQLLLLEVSYAAFESRRLCRSVLAGSLAGVYVGLFTILPGSFGGTSESVDAD